VPQAQLRRVIDRTAFAMAQQDVRYYLNGLLLEVKADELRAVATDGHRLATCGVPVSLEMDGKSQVIVPRKAVLELAKLMTDPESTVELMLSNNHIRAIVGDYTFTSKLVDGKFPDYERVIPRNGNKVLIADRQALRQVFQRTAILSNEKYRGIRLVLSENNMQLITTNSEQEEAQEDIEISYNKETIDIGFNVTYLIDVLNNIQFDQLFFAFKDSNSSCLVTIPNNDDYKYVVMPMRI